MTHFSIQEGGCTKIPRFPGPAAGGPGDIPISDTLALSGMSLLAGGVGCLVLFVDLWGIGCLVAVVGLIVGARACVLSANRVEYTCSIAAVVLNGVGLVAVLLRAVRL